MGMLASTVLPTRMEAKPDAGDHADPVVDMQQLQEGGTDSLQVPGFCSDVLEDARDAPESELPVSHVKPS